MTNFSREDLQTLPLHILSSICAGKTPASISHPRARNPGELLAWARMCRDTRPHPALGPFQKEIDMLGS